MQSNASNQNLQILGCQILGSFKVADIRTAKQDGVVGALVGVLERCENTDQHHKLSSAACHAVSSILGEQSRKLLKCFHRHGVVEHIMRVMKSSRGPGVRDVTSRIQIYGCIIICCLACKDREFDHYWESALEVVRNVLMDLNDNTESGTANSVQLMTDTCGNACRALPKLVPNRHHRKFDTLVDAIADSLASALDISYKLSVPGLTADVESAISQVSDIIREDLWKRIKDRCVDWGIGKCMGMGDGKGMTLGKGRGKGSGGGPGTGMSGSMGGGDR